MRGLAAVLAVLAVLFSTQGRAETCTFPTGTQVWCAGADITAVSPGAFSGCTASTDDKFVVPDGTDVIVADVCQWSTPGGLLLESGSSLTADNAVATNPVHFGVFEGDTDIAIEVEDGATLILKGAYRQWGVASPTLQDWDSGDDITWTVDLTSLCVDDAGELGDCTTGTNDQSFCFDYSNVRNSPVISGKGDGHIDESLNAVDADVDIVCMTSGMEKGWCYMIDSLDLVPDPYKVCLNVRQLARGQDGSTDDPADMPLASRDIVEDAAQTGNSYYAGDKCIESNGAMTGAIDSDGDMVGRCLHVFDASGQNGEPVPYAIVRTDADTDCDGGASADHHAIHLARGLRYDLVSDAEFAIAPCIGQGDTFNVIAPVSITADETIDDDEGQFLSAGTTCLKGVTLGGVASHFLDAEVTCLDHVNVHAGGDAGTSIPAMLFEDMDRVEGSWLTFIASDATNGGGSQLVFDNAGRIHLRDSGFKYAGGYSISGVSNASVGLEGIRLKFEQSGVVSTDSGAITNSSGLLGRITGRDWLCKGCTAGDTYPAGDMLESDNMHSIFINGLAVYGLPHGGVATNNNLAQSMDVGVRNLLGYGVATGRTGNYNATILPMYLDHAYMEDVVFLSGGPLNDGESVLTNSVFNGYDTGYAYGFLTGWGDTVFSNVVIHNADTSYGSCGAICKVISFFPDNLSPDTTSATIEYVTIDWTDGTSSLWDVVIGEAGTVTNETEFHFGSILISDFDNSTRGSGTVYGYYFTSAIIPDMLFSAGAHCMANMDASGAAAFQPIYSFVTYSGETVYLNRYPHYVDEVGGDGSLVVGSALDGVCGAKTGRQRPGLQATHPWLYETGGISPPFGGTYLVPEPKAY